jgi:hypothetical protein
MVNLQYRLFDDLVGARQQHWRNVETECPGGLQVNHKFKSGWLLYRKFGGFGPL